MRRTRSRTSLSLWERVGERVFIPGVHPSPILSTQGQRSSRTRRRKRRSGFSLLEVILATAILLACLFVLGQMAYVGRMDAEDAADATTAQLICRTKLNEILVGAAPVASVESQPVADMPDWVYSVEVESLDQFGLVSLRVSAMREPAEFEYDTSQHSGEQFSLTRWMHDASSTPDDSADFDWQIDPLFESPFDEEWP